MTKKTLFSIVGVLVLLVAGAAAYMYTSSKSKNAELKAAVNAEPNNAIAAGPVAALSASAITISKQDGTLASFSITAATAVSMAQDGQSSAPSSVSAIKVGTIVLITPAANEPEVAQTIVILPPPIPVRD